MIYIFIYGKAPSGNATGYSAMVPFTWSPPNMYSQNRKSNFGPFPYPSDRNDPFDSKNKAVRQIFDWVKIEGVIILKPVWISPTSA